MNFKIWHILFLIFVTSSCASTKQAEFNLQTTQNKFTDIKNSPFFKIKKPIPIHELKIDTLLTNRLSFKSLNAANAIGLLDILTNYMRVEIEYHQNQTLEKRIERLELLQEINQKINIASLEISAVAGELDYEEERIDQVAQYLKGKEDATERTLIISSIIVGATSAIAGEAISLTTPESNTPAYIGIGSSIIEASLGAAMLINKRKINFYHKTNPLKDIWNAPDTSNFYPPSIWYYLNYQNPKDTVKSLRVQLAEKWVRFGQIASAKEKNRHKIYELFFGEGGKYSTTQLSNRADMLDQVEANIKLMKQELNLLLIDIEKLNSK